MLWVLWDIVLPLVGTFLLGLFVGWLMWRWRRSRIDAEGLSSLRRSSARHKADAERLHQSNIDLSDRLQAASSAGGGDLANAKKRIDMLSEELKSSRREVAELKSNSKGSAVSSGAGTGTNAQVKDLRSEIAARDQMIATLKQSLEQFGEHGDTTVLMADIELRDRKIEALKNQLDSLQNNS